MKKIALSPGDPAGIGPEICLKSLKDNSKNLCNFELIGDIDFYRKLSKDLRQISGPTPAGSPGLNAILFIFLFLYLCKIQLLILEVFFVVVLRIFYRILFYKLYSFGAL